ncbi:hypothetical protein GCM10027614_74840 [Micromonospora vulcania]
MVLSTALAETSLTVPGVRVVVDAGLSRVPRIDLARGLGALITVPVSRAAATQRAGRAGREAPGSVYRCWSAATHERLPARGEPEIATADLTGFALELAAWGQPDGTGLALPDPPPPAAMAVARDTLTTLGAVDPDGRITGRGRAIAAAGAHPRLARALLDGAGRVGADRAAEVVALLAEESAAGPGDDLVAGWRRLRTGVDPGATARWRTEVRRLRAALPAGSPPQGHLDTEPAGARALRGGGSAGSAGLSDDLAAGLLVGLAYPERLARVRRPGGSSYLMTGGTAAELAAGSGLTGSEWLAVAVADRSPGAPSARIRRATPLDEATAREAAGPLLSTRREVGWSDGDVAAREVTRLGAIELLARRLDRPATAEVAAALQTGLRQEGLGLLTWTPAAQALRERLAFCRHHLGDEWPDVGDEALLAAVPTWLGPELAAARRRADLARVDVTAALRRLLPWAQAARLDELAPERIAVPSGSKIRVDYADPAAPVLAVKLQETFGWPAAPRIGGGRVPVLLHLLSPPGGRWRSPPIWRRSGGPAISRSVPSCAVDIPGTPGRRTRPRRRPPGTPRHVDAEAGHSWTTSATATVMLSGPPACSARSISLRAHSARSGWPASTSARVSGRTTLERPSLHSSHRSPARGTIVEYAGETSSPCNAWVTTARRGWLLAWSAVITPWSTNICTKVSSRVICLSTPSRYR